MLDTNTVGAIVSYRRPQVRARMRAADIRELCVSAISFAETTFGLAKKPDATSIASMTRAFFAEIAVLAFDSETAELYGRLRATMERQAKSLGALDMLIAAHALSVGATLVTSDRAFRFVPDLPTEDWLER